MNDYGKLSEVTIVNSSILSKMKKRIYSVLTDSKVKLNFVISFI